MKLNDFISKYIQTYPLLFKSTTYEKSKYDVLNQIFLVLGNGLEVAKTEKPDLGGYMCEPVYMFDDTTQTWVSVADLPYGKETYNPIPENYFETEIYENAWSPTYKILMQNIYPFHPYPQCEFGSGFLVNWLHSNVFLQPDWLDGLYDICERTLQYYMNETEYKNHSYYTKSPYWETFRQTQIQLMHQVLNKKI